MASLNGLPPAAAGPCRDAIIASRETKIADLSHPSFSLICHPIIELKNVYHALQMLIFNAFGLQIRVN